MEAPLVREAASTANAPGLQDYASIPRKELPHACFPHRLLSSVVDRLRPTCVRECPIASPPSSPTVPPPPSGSSVSNVPLPRASSPVAHPHGSRCHADINAIILEAEQASPPSPRSPFAAWLRPSGSANVDPGPLFLPEPVLPPSDLSSTATAVAVSASPSVTSVRWRYHHLILPCSTDDVFHRDLSPVRSPPHLDLALTPLNLIPWYVYHSISPHELLVLTVIVINL